jgi:YD repeat-containing protein
VSDSVDIATAPQTRYTFDAQGRCLGVDGPLGVTNNTYTPLNQIDAHTDADGHVTQYQYDPLGNLLRRIRPSTAQVEWTCDPVYNLPLTFTNELGKIWTLDYDPNGNLFKVTDPLGGFREYTYDGLSRRITVTDEDTRTTTFGYDAWSNVDRITDPAGHLIQLSRNVRGAVEQVTDQAGNLWQIHRGPKDEVASVEPPGPFAQFQLLYTAAGLLDVVTDPLGAPVRYAYDGLSRLVRREDPFGMPTTVERDGAGRVRRLTDASGAAETYTRDPAGRVTSVLDADGGMRSYIYNFCDLTDAIDALGNPAMFSYDLDHRPVRVQWPGITEDYAYDAADRLIRAERTAPGEPLIRELHTYDDANRRIQTQQTHLGRTVDYTYSPAGDALTVADNLQPLALTIGYNTRHLPVFAGAGGVPPVTAVYDSRSQIQTLAYSGSSLKSLYTYDAIGRLLTTSNQSASFLATYNAVYNVRGDREQVTGTSPAYGPYQHLVGFDLKRRITSEQIVPGPAATTYSYDPVDDRQQVDPPFGPLYTYSPGHRLLSGGTMTQLWDANGSVTQLAQPTRTLDYTYGADGRLTAISDGVQTWRFTHGPGGTLARVTLPGAIHRWLATDRGPRGPLRHVVLPAPGLAPALERIYAIDRGHSRDPAPVAEIRGAHATPNFRGLLTAYDGSVVQSAQANAPGTPEAERYFDRFGMVRWHAGAPQPEVGFQGMSGIVGLDSLWTQPLHVRPRLVFVRPNGPDALPPIVVDVVTCSPNSGTAQSDRGLGSDATPLNHDYFGYFDWMIKMWNYWRSRLIEEGFKGSLPPPIDWPPDPPFGPIPGGYGMVPGPPLEGLPGGALIELDDILGTLDAFPWVRDVDPNFHFDSPWMTDFHPGIQDPNQSSEPY